ncbi:unnamed protein product [Effrenium voratum]|nr:unnamed protein product [Effrenium voratum]
MASLVPVDPDLGSVEAPWLDEFHLLLVLSFIGLMWVLRIILCTCRACWGCCGNRAHSVGTQEEVTEPGQAMMGHYGLSPTSRLRHAPNWGARGNHQDVLIMRAALSAKNAKDKDPGWNQESEGVGSEFEAVGLYPEQSNIFKEAAEDTKAICDNVFTGTKGGPPGTARSLGLKEIMNGSRSNFAKGLLIKPAIDWLRAQWYSKVKASMRSALITAKDPWRRKMAVNRLEKDFCANSSRKAKASRRHTIKKVFENAGFEAMKVTPEAIKCLAASLKTGGYKSAHMYLAEAKLVHIESGAQWTDLHARTMKQCLLAVTRGLGPRKKAPEVPVARILEARITSKGRAKTLLALPKEVFLFGMMWMLREVEVASLKQGDLLINEQEKRVILNLNESKKDQEGRGVKRVLQCTCAEACDWACPLANAKALSPAKGAVDLEAPLCLTVGGTCPTKSQVVASWSKLFGMKVSGHSARRTGALNYIRQGWTIAQVAYLGRWKSDVIYSYAEEALESIPVNRGQFGATQSPLQGSAAEEVRTNLVVEIEALKLDSVATKARATSRSW